jgi:hypothetical protein
VTIETFELNDDHAYALAGPISFIVWRSETISEAAIRTTEAAGRHALERSPKGVGLLAFAEGATPSREVRRLSTQINARLHDAGAVGVAAVLAPRGVVGAVQRGMATGMILLSSQPYPLRVFADTADAVHWLAKLLWARGVRIEPATTAAEIDGFRETYLRRGRAVAE